MGKRGPKPGTPPKPGREQPPPAGKRPGKKLRRSSSKVLAHVQAARRRQVAFLRARGYEYGKIAKAVGCHENTVRADMEWIAKSWHEHMLQDYRVIREREVQLLEQARAEVLDAYFTATNRHGEERQVNYLNCYAKLTAMLHELLNLKDPLSFASAKTAATTAQMRTKIIEVEIKSREELRNFQAMTLTEYQRLVGDRPSNGSGE